MLGHSGRQADCLGHAVLFTVTSEDGLYARVRRGVEATLNEEDQPPAYLIPVVKPGAYVKVK